MVHEAAHLRLSTDYIHILLYQLKNAIVDDNWVVVEAILAILLHNDTALVAITVLSHPVVRELGALQPSPSDDAEAKNVLKRCETFASVLLRRLRTEL